ncbi:MAG: DegT/DnrJ/EryC1/StrS aminotransferase family protein [Cyclobacteriaceae bacterium]|nr:DegT/DnrJ/EryC1/StrS aminotransferase family protein [Cyclobacteriaceae bacterium]
MLNTKFSPWPCFSQEEADAVSKVLLSNRVNYWTGNETRQFEQEFADWAGTNYAIALMNGTVALEAALVTLGIAKGDEVIVTPRTFIASVSCIINVGAIPIFADVSLNSQNITPESIREKISNKTKAIICVHLAGWPCEMSGIEQVANEYGLHVVEDCAQAHGARYQGKSVGSLGRIGVWSFCQDKIMSTGGEGGMITTDDEKLWARLWSYKDHGKSLDKVGDSSHPPGFRWLHDTFGTNLRMTEIQAVLGRLQLKRMQDWSLKRLANSLKIDAACQQFGALRVPLIPPHINHAKYKHYVFVRPEKLKPGWSRDRIVEEINKQGVPCYHGSCPEVYLESAFEATEFRPQKSLPNAKELGETSLMFLVHPTLTDDEIKQTGEVIANVMEKASL